jgi:hypothetical protein
MIDLHFLCRRSSISYTQLTEVGVNRPRLAHLLPFLRERNFAKATLIEANPFRAEQLRRYFRRDLRIHVLCAAVCDVNEQVELYERRGDSFLAQISSSPAIASGFRPTVQTPKIKTNGNPARSYQSSFSK